MQPFFYKGRYYNHPFEKKHIISYPLVSTLFELYWNFFKTQTINKEQWYLPTAPVRESMMPALTWIGHSTFLIQVAGFNILTDPIFGHLALFFRRQLPPALQLQEIPPIDYILISHNHLDHMDSASLQFFKQHPSITLLVPAGNKKWFEKRGFPRVKEYSWWEQETFRKNGQLLTITFLPAYHWSQRSLLDFNRTLWGSWMMQAQGATLYFAGDTAFGPHFQSIATEFPSITCALMPIGPCEPNKWMNKNHINAEEAGQALRLLQARLSIPMHWGTYSFGTDTHDAPYRRLAHWWQQAQPAAQELITVKMGQRYEIAQEYLHLPSSEPQDIHSL